MFDMVYGRNWPRLIGATLVTALACLVVSLLLGGLLVKLLSGLLAGLSVAFAGAFAAGFSGAFTYATRWADIGEAWATAGRRWPWLLGLAGLLALFTVPIALAAAEWVHVEPAWGTYVVSLLGLLLGPWAGALVVEWRLRAGDK